MKPPGNKPMERKIGALFKHMQDYNIKYKKKTLNEDGGVAIGLK